MSIRRVWMPVRGTSLVVTMAHRHRRQMASPARPAVQLPPVQFRSPPAMERMAVAKIRRWQPSRDRRVHRHRPPRSGKNPISGQIGMKRRLPHRSRRRRKVLHRSNVASCPRRTLLHRRIAYRKKSSRHTVAGMGRTRLWAVVTGSLPHVKLQQMNKQTRSRRTLDITLRFYPCRMPSGHQSSCILAIVTLASLFWPMGP
mmetsp:Transcript_20383/g.58503  ORF Transcript_20383/g.58503 Transcript_20383/m.58503 type:complete len:200 (+) Transcript_20383:214-813(+)